MALPLQRIYQDNPGAVPASYALPPNLDMEFGSSRAKINGAGAASSFIVVLELLASDGRIMVQSRIDQEFSVGDTGALTWAPFLRRSRRTAELGTVVGVSLWQTVANPATIADGFVYVGPQVYDTVLFDSGGGWNPATPSRVYAPEDGVYYFRTQIGYDNTVAGSIGIALIPGPPGGFPGQPFYGEQQFSETGNFHAVANISGLVPLLAGEWAETWVVQKSGAARPVDPTASFLEIVKLGGLPAGTVFL